jgi:hypothetical protein
MHRAERLRFLDDVNRAGFETQLFRRLNSRVTRAMFASRATRGLLSVDGSRMSSIHTDTIPLGCEAYRAAAGARRCDCGGAQLTRPTEPRQRRADVRES